MDLISSQTRQNHSYLMLLESIKLGKFHNFRLDIKYTDTQSIRYIYHLNSSKILGGEILLNFVQWVQFHYIKKIIGIVTQIFQKEYSDTFIYNKVFQINQGQSWCPLKYIFKGARQNVIYFKQLEIEAQDQIKIAQFRLCKFQQL
ncbi:unnamed protein product [Paramecium octaurelia]|uniref:Uncharacterized protein n=1 Tax=Paramecium octaurelia TaxID=43137 RepID=A0A8S1VWH7_PAROT|nr:unnamed protein product [Paramecium octaurelia]